MQPEFGPAEDEHPYQAQGGLFRDDKGGVDGAGRGQLFESTCHRYLYALCWKSTHPGRFSLTPMPTARAAHRAEVSPVSLVTHKAKKESLGRGLTLSGS